ncbi:TonB-dependent receptor, partial [Acidobacteria bacterium AH-259-O06]|nr:TonB-dependent receptor [Acidobacteria bacterium AH-259-O06]
MANHSVFSFLYWFFSTVSLMAASGLSISGTVLDQTGSAVPDAILSLYNSTSLLDKTQSGRDGGFEFPSLLAGTYILECKKNGFQKQSQRIFLSDRAETVKLTLEIVGLNQHVLVIAAERPELATEISKAVSLVSAEELADRDVVSLTEALRQMPSLQIQQLGGPGTLTSYRFRGLRNQDTAILLDGLRFRDASDIQGSARPFLSDLLVKDAGRIEVLRGAGSTLYGSNAIGGIINVVSREPTQPLAGSFSFQGGSLGLAQGSGGFSGQTHSKRLSYSLHADHINYTRGLDDHDTYRNNSGKVRIIYTPSPRVRLFARFHVTDSFLFLNQSPSPLANLPPLSPGQFVRKAIPFPRRDANFYSQFDDPDSHQRNRFFNGAVRLTNQVNRVWSYTVGYQGLQTRRRFDDGPAVSARALELGFQDPPTTVPNSFRGTIHEVFWRNSLSVGSANSTNIGFDFERVALDQTAFGLATQAVQRSLAFSVQNQTRLLRKRLHLHLAFQAQRYGLDAPRFSESTDNPFASVTDLEIPATYNGDVSLAYFFADSGTKVRVHAGNGYRSPSLFERFGSSGTRFRFYFGNPLLR